MNNILFLVKKELKETLWSPLFYILTGVFSLLVGWMFFNYVVLSKELTNLSMSVSVVRPMFGNMNFILLFMVPLITMKSLAEEQAGGTLNLLLLSNLTQGQIIIGKFLSSLITITFMIGFTLLFPIILAWSGFTDWGVVALGYLGIFFSVACYTSVGIFSSSLTRNQIISAIIAFGILFGVIVLDYTANASDNLFVQRIFSYVSIPYHFEFFTRGVVSSFNLVYFISFCAFFLILAKFSVEAKKW